MNPLPEMSITREYVPVPPSDKAEVISKTVSAPPFATAILPSSVSATAATLPSWWPKLATMVAGVGRVPQSDRPILAARDHLPVRRDSYRPRPAIVVAQHTVAGCLAELPGALGGRAQQRDSGRERRVLPPRRRLDPFLPPVEARPISAASYPCDRMVNMC
jgi:hypothetical protein